MEEKFDIAGLEQLKTARPGLRYLLGWALVVAGVVCVVWLLLSSRHHELMAQTARLRAQERSGPRVLVKPAASSPRSRDVEVPASIHGFAETALYAKTAGYLKEILVDKGDRVRRGQVLARLSSPELDRQVADAKANYWLQKTTDDRNQKLVKLGVTPQQTADDSHAAMQQALANYQQLLAMQSYETIAAPFDGIITARYYDPGALIPQATSPASATPVLSMASLEPVRVYAYLPQNVAPFIHNGAPAIVTVDEYAGRQFEGSVTRHPEALDANSLTMLVEVDLPNRDRLLYPGMYARMRVTVPLAGGTPMVPDDALIFRDNRIYVPVVRDSHLRLMPVRLGWDNGYDVEVLSGIQPGELVAITVGQAARDGERVQAVMAH